MKLWPGPKVLYETDLSLVLFPLSFLFKTPLNWIRFDLVTESKARVAASDLMIDRSADSQTEPPDWPSRKGMGVGVN